MAPPQFSDVGKSAKDLFDKGYNYGFCKVDVKGLVGAADVTLKTSSKFDDVSMTNNVSSFGGSFETKFKHQKHGITFLQKIDSKNTIGMELGIEDGPFPVTQGGKATLCTSFSPSAEKVMSALLKTSYKNDHFTMSLDSDFNCAGPMVAGTFVTGYEGFLAGHAFTYDTAKSALLKNNVTLGFVHSDIQGTLSACDWSKYGASLFQKVNDNLSIGTQIGWSKGDAQASFGVAAKYAMGKCGAAQLKVCNNGTIAAAFTKNLSSGVKVTTSACLDTKGVAAGHKFGIGVEYQL